MDAPGRVVHPLVVLGLILVAVVGYLAGSRHSTHPAVAADPPSAVRSLNHDGLLFEYPTSWHRAAPAVIPGLALVSAVAVAPAEDAEGGGLTVGELPSSDAGPLPRAFLARLPRLPRVEVVNLVSTQAYRYSELRVPGWKGALDVYVIPSAAAGSRLLACYGRRKLASAAQECEAVVNGVTLTGQPVEALAPEPAYAKAVARIVSSLSSERRRARGEMSGAGISSARLATAATELATRMTAAAASLAALHTPQPAAAAGEELSRAFSSAANGYSNLARAARSNDVAAYDAARSSVGARESEVNGALSDLSLLGYGR